MNSRIIELSGARLRCVQCAACKAPLGFMEPANVDDRSLDDFQNRVTDVLRVIVSSLQATNARLARIEEAIRSKL